MAIQKITADVISSDAITTNSISDSAITAAKLAGTLDLTGKTITVATASSGDNDTSIASTAFVQQELASLVDSAPGTLNTLNELAAALGDDANFSTTITNSIALKAPLASPTFTGNAVFDTSTLVVDATNDRVGIGTSSPGAPLDLETAGNTADGTYYSTFTINNTGSSTWSRIRFDRSGVARWGLSLGTDDKFKINNLFTGGTTASPDDNALVIDNNSNVGIGTDSPDGLLHISSGTSGDAILILESDTDNNDEADNPQIWFKGDGDITKGAVRVSDNELEIISNVSAASGIKFYTGATDNTGTTDPGTSATQRMHIESNGKIDISGYTTEGAYLSSKGSFRIDIDNDNDHTDRAFIISSNNAASDLVTVLEGGDVGIGTSSTNSFKTYIDASSGKGLFVQSGDGGYTALGFDSDSGNARMSITGHNGELWMGGENSAGTGSQGEFRLKPGSSAGNVLYLDGTTGDVGIGTNAPNGYRLEVYDGDYTQMMLRGPTYPMLRFKADNQNSGNNALLGVGAGNSFSIQPNNTTNGIIVSNSGHVTMPNQPAFHAYGPSSSISDGSVVVYANTYVNTGSHYSTSNGRFTAPVAGVYLFFWSAIGNNTNDVYRWFIHKNGSATGIGANDVHLRQDTSATGSEYATNGSRVQMVSLSANDYVYIYYDSDGGTAGYFQSDYVNFGGYLIG